MTSESTPITLRVARTSYEEVTIDLPRYYRHDVSGDDYSVEENEAFGKITADKVVSIRFLKTSNRTAVELEVIEGKPTNYGSYLTNPMYAATKADWEEAVARFRQVLNEPL